MILGLIAKQLERKAGRPLRIVTLRMDPTTYKIDGVFTDADGKSGDLVPQQGDKALTYALGGKVKWDEVHVYTATFDYLTRSLQVNVYGIHQGLKVTHAEHHTF